MQVKMRSLPCYGVLIFTLLLSCSVQAEQKKKAAKSQVLFQKAVVPGLTRINHVITSIRLSGNGKAFRSSFPTYNRALSVELMQGTDCTQIKIRSPSATSGVYQIKPAGFKSSFKVFCEMNSDGGWTVFQRRTGGSVSFNRKWAAYKNGFGNQTDDHWLGLKKVFALTKKKSKNWILRVDLWDHEGGTAVAEYKDFRLGNEKTAFKLHVGKYSGNAGDAIRGAYAGIDQNGFGFSTIDRDNDGCSPCIFGDIAELKCAFSKGGGWWYSRCGSASLNGDWHPSGDHTGWASGLHWLTWKGPAPYSAKATRMMIKSM